MRTRVLVVGVVLWISTAVPVSAVSVRDIVELSRAGLGDEVILALIDIDPVRYDLDAQRVLELKDAGVSERVLAAMLRSGRSAPPVVTPVPPASGPASGPARPARTMMDWPAPALTIWPVFQTVVRSPVKLGRRRHGEPRAQSLRPFAFGVDPFAFGVDPFFAPSRVTKPVAPLPPPVYWGWGGQRRPDTWDPAPRRPAERSVAAR